MTNVIYTGYFVDDPQQLLMQAPVQLKGSDLKVHAHHVTKEFRPHNGRGNVKLGRKVLLTVYAQVINDKVQAVLVRSESGEKLSTNTHPHITIATSTEQNRVIQMLPLRPPTTTTKSYTLKSPFPFLQPRDTSMATKI